MSPELSTSQKPKYILTLDLGEKLEAFKRIGIDAPGPYDEFTRDLQSEIQSVVKSALPDVEVVPIHMADLSDEVIGASTKLTSTLDDPLVVSSCPEIAYPAGGEKLEINRLINIRGEQIGLGPRPGYPSLKTQVNRIRNMADSRDIVIVEDGIFTGGTVRQIVKEFEAARMNIRGVVAGFSCTKTDTKWFEANGYDLLTGRSYDEIHDWVPDHDFIPFVPGNGKVIGVELGEGSFYPYYDHRRASYSVPYIQPFSSGSEWTSIPAEKVNEASGKFLSIAFALFKEIERRNSDRDIRVGDILSTRQRSSIPMVLGSENFPPLTSRITSYIRESM